MQKTLIIARGPSGSGKSTMSRNLAEKFNAPIFATDDFWMQEGNYAFDPRKLPEAHEWNRKRVQDAMNQGLPVIIADNTNTQFWEFKPYVEMAQQYGYEVDFQEPNWSPELKTPDGNWNIDFLDNIQQQEDRRASGKVVPRQAIEGMISRYEHNPTVESVLRSERPTFR